MSVFSKLIKRLAWKTGKYKSSYIKFCRPNGYEYANYLQKWGNFYSIGEDCSIKTYTNITDPQYVRIGNNVQLSNCSLFGHDGSIACLNKAFNVILDRVGKIDIKDNVYIGHGAVVLPNVSIGPNALVAAGSVVTKTVPPDAIVAGSPAKVIGSVNELVKRMEIKTKEYPWYDLLVERGTSGFDPAMEPTLQAMRVKYFYGDET